MNQTFLIALGGNLTLPTGEPKQTQQMALQQLENSGAVIRALSPFYHTPAFPAGAGPDFVNAAAVIRASWSPQEALVHLHRIEADLGRVRQRRWGERAIDMDLIACGDRVLPDAETFTTWHDLSLEQQMEATPDELILPHPRLQDRAFVLVPLADVAPDWVHPVLGKTVQQMRDALPPDEISAVRALL